MQHRAPRTLAALTLLTCATFVGAQDAAPLPDAEPDIPVDRARPSATNAPAGAEITPALNAAVRRGLDALAQLQVEDGSFPTRRYRKHVGITALCCLAFMADGSLPGRGRYGDVVEKGLRFVLNNINETGLVAADTSHGPMYGHGFATLFLGEVYGMTRGGGDTALSTELHDALVRACRLIINTQNDEGGWRYNPVPQDADISVTICQIMALRSARNAGIEIQKSTIDRAVRYVRDCQNQDGGFRYQLGRGGSAWPRSAAGVASLYYAGIYEGDDIDRGLDYLLRTALPGQQTSSTHYFYGHYYSVQAMYLAGGDYWATWWPAIRDELITRQREDDDLWTDSYGESYGTAMALIILQMPKRYLPIFQK
jgi:hypothetical protein